MSTRRPPLSGPGPWALITALLLLTSPATTVRAADGDYWFAFPDQTVPAEHSVHITAENGAYGSLLFGTSGDIPFSLAPGETTVLSFPQASLSGSGYHPEGGYRVQANAEVSVTVFMAEENSGDAIRPLAERDLGTEYVVVSSPAHDSGTMPSQFLVVGTADGTTVTITASASNTAGLAQGVPTDIPLGQGEVYQVQAPLAGEDLTGTIITSSAPVAVISGHYAGLVPAGESCCASFMAACLPPMSAWGEDYFVANTLTRAGDVFRVVAGTNGTVVSAPGHSGAIIDRGGFIEFTSSGLFSVASTAPVMLAQYFTSSTADGVTAGDPSLLIPPPDSVWGARHEFSASEADGVTSYLNLVTSTADTGSVILDGGSVVGWVNYGNVEVKSLFVTPGPHVVESAGSVMATVYGFKPYWSYGYYCRGDSLSTEPPPEEPPENPVITSVLDVPNDQGRQVRLVWESSSLDAVGPTYPIVEYALYRRHDPDLKSDWDFVGTVPAFGQDSYAAVLPTLADSTVSDGLYWSYFKVRAATDVPTTFFDSKADSGYSVDNLAPSIPTMPLLADGVLTWDECPDADFDYFTVYGSSAPDLAGATVVGYTTGPSLTIPGAGYPYLLVTATDFSGNESGAAVTDGVTGVDETPSAFRLLGAAPNPFNPSTTIRFELPEARIVDLLIYDASGRLVRSLMRGEAMSAGRRGVEWDGRDAKGRTAAAGVYYYRLYADADTAIGRMVLLK